MRQERRCHDPKWCLFFDFHTMPAVPDVGAAFDVEAVVAHFKACGADFVVFPARCNLGMAYYNTKVGIRHPSLKFDLFGRLSRACRKAGIAISAYINVGLSHEEASRHREWCILTPEGYTYRPDRLDSFFRGMCFNTPYGDHVAEMAREVVRGYPVSGLFLDCMWQPPCVGVECVREMKVKGMDWSDPRHREEFARLSRVRMAGRIAEAAKAIRPDLLLYFNGVDYEDQEDIGNYLEYECLPTHSWWGYDSLPAHGRYLRTLGKPVLNMTGRFHQSWGDFGGIRPEASLEYDCLHGLALGLRTTIGDHFHPRGDINRPVFDMVKRIYGRLRRLEPWLEKASGLSEVAVVNPAPEFAYAHVPFSPTPDGPVNHLQTLRGAARLLAELNQQFDVVSPHRSWDGYDVLILPDYIPLSAPLAAKVRAHLKRGGRVLATGWSGLDPERRRFVLREWGLRYDGECPHDPAYLRARPDLASAVPDMPLDLYARGISVVPRGGTRVLGEIVAPYFSRHWDGEHGHVYTPPDRATGRAAVTLRGPVAHVTHAVFTAYFLSAAVPTRQIVGRLLDRLLPAPLVRASGLPSFARVTVTAQKNRRMIHVLSYVPERRGKNTDVIEEPIELRDVRVSLRADGRKPERVYLAPSEEPLPHEMRDEYIETTIPVVRGYAMVVFEER